MIKAQASICAGDLSFDPADALSPELEAGLRQRLALFEAILADLLGPRTIHRLGLIPISVLKHHPACCPAEPWPGGPFVPRYGAELILCLDGVWRVRADDTGAPENHRWAGLFQASALAPFLPRLCRTMLGAPLRLPSIPILWLADRESRMLWAANSGKWLLHHGFDRPETLDGRALESPADRLAWQRRLDSAPWALTASHAWCWSDRSLMSHRSPRHGDARDVTFEDRHSPGA